MFVHIGFVHTGEKKRRRRRITTHQQVNTYTRSSIKYGNNIRRRLSHYFVCSLCCFSPPFSSSYSDFRYCSDENEIESRVYREWLCLPKNKNNSILIEYIKKCMAVPLENFDFMIHSRRYTHTLYTWWKIQQNNPSFLVTNENRIPDFLRKCERLRFEWESWLFFLAKTMPIRCFVDKFLLAICLMDKQLMFDEMTKIIRMLSHDWNVLHD